MNYLSTQSSLETIQNHNLMFSIQIELHLPVNFDLNISQKYSDKYKVNHRLQANFDLRNSILPFLNRVRFKKIFIY